MAVEPPVLLPGQSAFDHQVMSREAAARHLALHLRDLEGECSPHHHTHFRRLMTCKPHVQARMVSTVVGELKTRGALRRAGKTSACDHRRLLRFYKPFLAGRAGWNELFLFSSTYTFLQKHFCKN